MRILPLLLLALAWHTASAQGRANTGALDDVPGFDFSSLSEASRKEFLTLLTDEFDYCGRPFTLLGAIKKTDVCKHTRRLVGWAAKLAKEGSPAHDIVLQLSQYNQTFTKPRQTLKVANDLMCVGPKDAKVTLIEFSDFECPHCAAARPVLEAFAKQKSQMRFCSLPYPLPGHANALLATQAALFAREAGKYWPMHDALFENQLSLSETFIRSLIVKLGLDLKTFDKAISSRRFIDEIEALKESGRSAGVDATPTLFMNGRKLSIATSADMLGLTYDDEVEWLAGNRAWPSN